MIDLNRPAINAGRFLFWGTAANRQLQTDNCSLALSVNYQKQWEIFCVFIIYLFLPVK